MNPFITPFQMYLITRIDAVGILLIIIGVMMHVRPAIIGMILWIIVAFIPSKTDALMIIGTKYVTPNNIELFETKAKEAADYIVNKAIEIKTSTSGGIKK